MTKIVVHLENAQLSVLKEAADKLKMSVGDYVQKVLATHSDQLKDEPVDIFSPDHGPLQTPTDEQFQKIMKQVLEKNKELYKRLA
jgi:KaiC/GvpD/RAD55 family RecA-like ATPase